MAIQIIGGVILRAAAGIVRGVARGAGRGLAKSALKGAGGRKGGKKKIGTITSAKHGIISKSGNPFKGILKQTKKMGDDFEKLSDLSVEIGLPDDRIHNPSGLPLSKLGAIHEFGLGNVPERSFLRGWAHVNRADIRSALKMVSVKVTKGEGPLRAMERLALWGEGGVKEHISNGIANFTPLDQSTIARRKDGSSNPLNDTGALKQGVIGVVVKD